MPDSPQWDPQQYLRHSVHRTRPFIDLLARIPDLPQPAASAGTDADAAGRGHRIADLGCGPGNVTALLA
ncbi:trans-aconitate methyltransferase, partial [Streptomyces sp. HSW2009]